MRRCRLRRFAYAYFDALFAAAAFIERATLDA